MRLLSSLTAAAAVLADQAAARLDTWVENAAGADEAPRDTPLGFTPATGADAPDPEAIINAAAARGLAGEQRDRWLAEVKGRLDVSTGGPWCTEERDKPTGRIMSPYGVIANGVTREADRDLIEDARADLFGLLALAEHDDEVINALKGAARRAEAERAEAERELQVMHHRERAVDMVAAAWVDGSLKGYRYGVDPGEPAGRVIAAIEGITASRGKTIRDLQSQLEATHGELLGMNQREADVERVLDAVVDGRIKLDEYVDPETPAGRVRDLVDTLLKQVREAEARADIAERKLDAHHRHDAGEADDPFMPAAEARQHAHTIEVALDMYDNGADPLASLTLHHPFDLSARVAALASHALNLGKRGAINADAVREVAAARIRAAAAIAEDAIAVTPADDETDAAVADAFVAGLRAAANLAEDIEPAPDLNVAHIDTVNGRGPTVEAAVRTADDNTVAIANKTGGTVLRENGDGRPIGIAYPATEETAPDER